MQKKIISLKLEETTLVTFGDVFRNTELNQIEMNSKIDLKDMDPKKVFFFLINLKKYYLNLSNDHKTFEISNNRKTLSLGDKVNNIETANNQTLVHNYEVIEFDQNKKLILESSNTSVSGKYSCVPYKVTVYVKIGFKILISTNGTSTLESELLFRYPNVLIRKVAERLNTEEIWAAHFKEEMINGSQIVQSKEFDDFWKRNV